MCEQLKVYCGTLTESIPLEILKLFNQTNTLVFDGLWTVEEDKDPVILNINTNFQDIIKNCNADRLLSLTLSHNFPPGVLLKASS